MMKRFNLILAFKNLLRKESGFTLIEILIAITILAFMTLGVVSITDNAVLTMERTTEANQNNLQIETAMSRFEWDFSQIYSPLYFTTVMNLNQNMNAGNPGQPGGDQTGADAGAGGGIQNNPYLQQYYEQLVNRLERNEHFSAVSKDGAPIPLFYSPEKTVFEFFTSSNRRKIQNQKQSHFGWVRYALAPQEARPEEEENPKIPKSLKSFIRYFDADDPYGPTRIDPQSGDTKGAVLLRNVESLEFQFWDLQKRKWETSLKSIPNGENIIRGVRILITWYDSQGKKSATRIFRTHWPLVVPQDQPAARANTTTGPNTGTTGDTQFDDGTN